MLALEHRGLGFKGDDPSNHIPMCNFQAKCKATVSVVTVVQYYKNFVQNTHKHVVYHCVQEKQSLKHCKYIKRPKEEECIKLFYQLILLLKPQDSMSYDRLIVYSK